MVASGVSVISKKHVKVPRLAMHGAYICYYDRQGDLHEEKYIGTRKIWDEDVDVCRFVPPDRASYFYMQAVGGGGAGGSSGYNGGNRVVVWSKEEVIPPFGITNEWLELKGISSGEFSGNGGTLWAYAEGTDLYGDAGDGGDIFYIKRVSGNCFVEEQWENPSKELKKCVDNGYRYADYKTRHDCTYYYKASYSTSSCPYYYGNHTNRDCDHICHSYDRDTHCWGGTWSSPCYSYWDWSESSCEDYLSTCTGQRWVGREKYYPDPEDDPTYWYWKDVYEDYDYSCWKTRCWTSAAGDYTWCNDCTIWYDTSKSVTYYTHIPKGSECSLNYSNVTFDNNFDIAPQGTGTMPPIVLLEQEGTMKGQYGKGDAKIRDIIRADQSSYTVCNYGNPESYSGNNGIFGSCFMGYDCKIDSCSASEISNAYGEKTIVYPSGTTSISQAKDDVADQRWYPGKTTVINGKTYKGVWYDLSEENGGIDAYGRVCQTDSGGGCSGYADETETGVVGDSLSNEDSYQNGSFRNPWTGSTSGQVKSRPTSCTDTNVTWSNQGNGKPGSCNVSQSCSETNETVMVRTPETWECNEDASLNQDDSCLYGTSNLPANSQYAYVIETASGEEGGVGKKCAFSAGAATNLVYKGYSGMRAGIDGSDKNTVGTYKAIFCAHCPGDWGTWKSQSSAWAQNGTDSFGYAEVELGGSKCSLHTTQVPLKGHGACLINNGTPVGYPGTNYTACNHDGIAPKDGSATGAGIGSSPPGGCSNGGHVGYCLINKGQTKPFGKYTYKYSWARNNLAYGLGGEPGEYRSMIIRSFKDRDLIVIPGEGGRVQGCTGGSGGDTVVYSVPRDAVVDDSATVTSVDGVELMLQVDGGAGGAGCIPTPDEVLPYDFDAPYASNSESGTPGKSPDFVAKSNIMGVVLPLDDSVLGQWLRYAGSSGYGGGSYNNCWVSSWERYFEGTQVCGGPGCWDEGDVPCLGQAGEIPAGRGIPGAVLIKW